ncbi:deoxyuridine 5'-triphosphate nucleotidohydrolase, partial [Candidatus Phytoplasma phoenicium]
MNKDKQFVFKIVTSYQNQNINLPRRKTLFSAGYDFEVAQTTKIEPQQIILIPTGIKACFSSNKILFIYARSSLSLKKKLMLANHVGVIDSDYYNNPHNEGHILIPLYNFSQQEVLVEKYERIAQGILQNYYITNDDYVLNNYTRKS